MRDGQSSNESTVEINATSSSSWTHLDDLYVWSNCETWEGCLEPLPDPPMLGEAGPSTWYLQPWYLQPTCSMLREGRGPEMLGPGANKGAHETTAESSDISFVVEEQTSRISRRDSAEWHEPTETAQMIGGEIRRWIRSFRRSCHQRGHAACDAKCSSSNAAVATSSSSSPRRPASIAPPPSQHFGRGIPMAVPLASLGREGRGSGMFGVSVHPAPPLEL